MGSLRKANGPLKMPRLRLKEELLKVLRHHNASTMLDTVHEVAAVWLSDRDVRAASDAARAWLV
jgi:hypothetical protein